MHCNLTGWQCEIVVADGEELPCFSVERDGTVTCAMEEPVRQTYLEKLQSFFLKKFPF